MYKRPYFYPPTAGGDTLARKIEGNVHKNLRYYLTAANITFKNNYPSEWYKDAGEVYERAEAKVKAYWRQLYPGATRRQSMRQSTINQRRTSKGGKRKTLKKKNKTKYNGKKKTKRNYKKKSNKRKHLKTRKYK